MSTAEVTPPVSVAKRNRKHQPSVSFQIVAPQPDEEEDNEGSDGGKIGQESVADMLSILQEYKKKKSAKSSSRAAALEAKKKSIRDAAYTQVRDMEAAGAAYMEDMKVQIEMLQEQEAPCGPAFADIAAIFGRCSKEAEAQFGTLTHLLAELSPARAEIIEENSTNLHSHAAVFAAMRKQTIKTARRKMHSGNEQQKLATDAQAYIKHYKHLIQT